MATADFLTPTKHQQNSVPTGHRIPFAISPKTPGKQAEESIHTGPSTRVALTPSKNSPKSNISRKAKPSSRGISGGKTSQQVQSNVATSKSKKRQHTTADRFIPTRDINAAEMKVQQPKTPRPKSSSSEGSSLLAAGATSILDFSRPTSSSSLALSMDSLSLNDRRDDGDDDDNDSYVTNKPSPSTLAYQKSVAEACGMNLQQRILEYKPKAPSSSRPVDLRAQYSRPLRPTTLASTKSKRRIVSAPERVLDAPSIADDYYLNLLDWSSGNQIAIALDRSVYVWSAESGNVASLLECPEDTYISSVKWSQDGAYVAAGLGSGETQIWDVEDGTKLRSMHSNGGADGRVGVMGWNKHLLTTGSRSGMVVNHDVRIAQHKVAELNTHTSEVCGLEWRSDGSQLATGGNDNLVAIWDARSLNAPKFEKTNHRAAVKALSWCPWQSNLLATGGGSNDRHIHFWNSTTGARVNSIDTGSQVTSLRWSLNYKELVSSSGFPDNSLSIWAYPSLVKHAEIPAHESRILASALSPDGQMLATAAADESLKFWKLFEKKTGATGGVGATVGEEKKMSGLSRMASIR
ncbi:WD40 repeat-like protein [Polychaeton citri CBS 116435]|uniref:WD40 repeat-like protein n=1 Tax=Polychaeton citri CBS 116435 TaxID=1314669 RepID=A0A9P4UP76_9PEZI|nr:WD40 repeat-like protein [Polychaeton citri CBS 116435]